MDFGEALKKIRIEQGLSQREIGERLNVSQQTIAQYERAVHPPKMETIERLAGAMELPVSDLLALTTSLQLGDIYEEYKKQGLFSDIPESELKNDFYCIDENLIASLVNELNSEGLSRIYEHLIDLLKIPEYRKDSTECKGASYVSASKLPDSIDLILNKQLLAANSSDKDSCKQGKSSHHQFNKITTSKEKDLNKGKPELLAAHARTDIEQTPEGVQHDLDIMNNDSEWD